MTNPLCAVLGFDPDQKLKDEDEELYRTFTIGEAKKGGKLRTVMAPCDTLKTIQRTLLTKLLGVVAPHPSATAYFKGRSIAANALPHLGCACLYKTDIVDFFGSIKAPVVVTTLRQQLPHLSEGAVRALLPLVTHEGALPAGAPTSPHLANLALAEFDAHLTDICGRLDARYTRYADDISISAPSMATLKMLDVAVRTGLAELGCTQNTEKTRFWGPNVRKVVTGLDVSGLELRPPRAWRKRVAALVRMVEIYPHRLTPSNRRRIMGYLFFWRGIAPEDLEVAWLLRRMDRASPTANRQSGFAEAAANGRAFLRDDLDDIPF